jgi:type III secretion protein U
MSSSEKKTKQATPRKLRKAREDGMVAQSRKAISLFVVAVLLGTMIPLLKTVAQILMQYFNSIFPLVGQPLDQVWDRALHEMTTTLLKAVGPVAGIGIATVLATTVMFHRGIPFSMKPIVPNFSRLDPAQGLQRIFGLRSWVESSIGLLQLIVWSSLSAFIILQYRDDLLGLYSCGLPCVEVTAWSLFQSLALAAIILFLLIAGIEVILQFALYRRDQKMTASEFKREMKDNFGSPEIRRARARLRREEQFYSTVNTEVIGAGMANMCFYSNSGAVAVRYHPEIAPVPYICAIASGRDVTALRAKMRESEFPEMRSRKIVEICLKRPVGTPVPPEIHTELAACISKMFV